jgi:TonB-dependent receptor
MSVRLPLTTFLLLICCTLFSQTLRLNGKVSNDKNDPIAGATVSVAGKNGTTTNSDGTFALGLPTGKYEITVSAVGYETKVIGDVEVAADAVNEMTVVLAVRTKQEQGIVISARSSQRKETVNSLITFQKNTNTVASVISAETIRRSPDRNTGEVLKRTPGASIQEGRFLVVRGLPDRYNQAMLNGILLTSTEPDRKTFSFDLIPAPMIDNIVINKAFVPEFPGEWAGGLVQVNTKDIPTRNFFNVQIGTGFNSQTTGKTFYRDQYKGKLDWLGIEDGTRSLPSSYTTKSSFDTSGTAAKSAIGRQMANVWSPLKGTAPLNVAFQANGGFSGKLWGKSIGGTFGLFYTKNNRYVDLLNRLNTLDNNGNFGIDQTYEDDRYQQETTLGGLGSLSLQINPRNRVSVKTIVNVNTNNSVTQRNGFDYNRNDSLVRGSEMTFRQNTFFTVQANGDHTLSTPLRLRWYGAFNILDGYTPDQRRLVYTAENASDPYRLLISNSLSQQSGSRVYQTLSDYIYTGGADLSFNYDLFGQRQTLKGGYMFQVRDRLYDAQLFANYLPNYNSQLVLLPPAQVFAPENFGTGSDNGFAFDAIKNRNFRYMANTILNAGYLQLDNQFSNALRVVWGVRAEHYDQLIGSVKKWDPRHMRTEVLDFLPGFNATYKLNSKTNLRFSGSQTVVRPELRELAALNLYDFELNASVQGNPELKRTKVSNLDLRYEFYPQAGEVLTVGAFYKYFKNPIEAIYTPSSGGASTFNYQNPEKASSYGVELEFRKKLDFINLANFSLQANTAYIYSRVRDEKLQIDRPLQGQSPYVVNVGLMYDLQKYGLTSTVLYNQIGQRIAFVGNFSNSYLVPDIYEAPRPVLDFQVTKKLLNQKAELRLNVSDILNKTLYFYQNAKSGENTGFDKASDAYRFTRRFGTTYTLTFNYSL